MTKTLKRTFVALVLAIFAFLPFVFAGCNEKDIENYKTQISTLQEQNTSLQEQVDTIHTPTQAERMACIPVVNAVNELNKDSSPEVQALAFRLETTLMQYTGIEFNKVLNVTYPNQPFSQKEQIKIENNSVLFNIEAKENNNIAGYAFFTVNYNAQTLAPTKVKLEQYTKNSDDTYFVEVQEFTVGADDPFTQTQYTEGSIFESVKQKALDFAKVAADTETTMIQASFF